MIHSHRGMTLVELLATLTITLLLAAVTLPTIHTLLVDRKFNQAAVMTRSFFESARIRAIGRQREVAVILDRNTLAGSHDANRNIVLQLSMAEVMPPYRGDLEQSNVLLGSANVAPYALGTVNQATISLSENPTARHFLNLGDRIAFDDQPERFEIVAFEPMDATGKIDASASTANIIFWNQPRDDVYRGTNRQGSGPDSPVTPLRRGVTSFRVYNRPQRLFTQPVTLPQGLCIDLSLSGNGAAGYDFASDVIIGTMPPDDARLGPIVIVFNPQGNLSTLYQNQSLDLRAITPDSSIYFLIGRTDRVGLVRSANAAALQADPSGSNLSDGSSYWLKIAPENGQISLAPNAVIPPELTVNRFEEILSYGRGLGAGGVHDSGN